ncbi:MAG: MoxR family ATPase [Actinomycetota bacterium]|nr:MoxR family ATPase [Actinomycetota bacterium]
MGEVAASMARVISGKPEAIRLSLVALLAEGHLLIEDVPGVGKTMLAKSLARSLDCSMNRIQFTPDLLPGDVTGVSVFDQRSSTFEFRAGAIFAHIVLGDEINRASPKTQSALLEAMEEQQVSVDGQTHRLPQPFMVIATQNPVEMEGTYPLPEAQRDRFMLQISLGYPDASAEIAMISTHELSDPLESLTPVTDAATLRTLRLATRSVYTSDSIKKYVVSLVSATRGTPLLRLGASPRASVHLVHAAKAMALLSGRDHVLPDDVQALAVPVLSHRVLLSTEAHLDRRNAPGIIADLVTRVPVA